MRVRTFIVFLVVVFLLLTGVEAVCAQEWAKSYGEAEMEGVYSIERVFEPGWVGEKGYVVAGVTESFGAGEGDIWILNLARDGSINWQKTYGETNYDYAKSIQQTTDGGYIVAALTHSFGAGSCDFWVLKLDANGCIEWQKTYGGTNRDEVYSIQQTADGGYIVAGTTGSFGAGSNAFWILKLDASGGIEWQKTYGLPGHITTFASSIQQTTDGGYIVSGSTSYFDYPCYDLWILKLDANGGIQWQKAYGGTSSSEFGNSIQQTSDGGYIIASGTMAFGAGNYDFWILKLDANGGIEWQKTYGGTDSDYANSIYQTMDEGYVVAGYTYSFGAGDRDFWILKLDANGGIEWQKTYGGTDQDGTARYWDHGKSIQQTTDGGYIIGGVTCSFGAGGEDYWILKLDRDGDIPFCNIIEPSNAEVHDTTAIVHDTTATIDDTTVTPEDTTAIVHDTTTSVETQCPSPTPVPAITPFGLIALIGILTLLASWTIKRK